jgi:DinB family protein
MSTVTKTNEMERVLREGWGDGAWHGPDLKAALADVTPELAFRRPTPGRHNIAEIAMHQAFHAHAVRGKLSAKKGEPFPLEGEDWFELDGSGLGWPGVLSAVKEQQERLAAAVADAAAGRNAKPMSDAERFDLVLGITCHAIYHAGQIQLVKKLLGA